MARIVSTSEYVGKRVVAHKPSKKNPEATNKVGKVRYCVFHPKERRCVGFIVKRPDVALMFHRKDLFVSIHGYDMVDGRLVVRNDPSATDKGACKALGVNWDDCVLWVGLPVISKNGTELGLVGEVDFDADTGKVECLHVTQGATANVLLGKRDIPASMVRGFKRGIGTELAVNGEEDEEPILGAILVDDEATALETDGGLAAKAGEATAVASNKVHEKVDEVKPAVSEATAKAGEAVNKGAYATGRQIKRASGMFSEFKEEYDKARHGDSQDADEADDKPGNLVEYEYIYVEEDADTAGDEEAEIVYVDEDGNVLDANVTDDEDEEVVYVYETVVDDEPSSTSSTKAKPQKEEKGASYAVGKQLKRASGMFLEFKEEYDKARHDSK